MIPPGVYYVAGQIENQSNWGLSLLLCSIARLRRCPGRIRHIILFFVWRFYLDDSSLRNLEKVQTNPSQSIADRPEFGCGDIGGENPVSAQWVYSDPQIHLGRIRNIPEPKLNRNRKNPENGKKCFGNFRVDFSLLIENIVCDGFAPVTESPRTPS